MSDASILPLPRFGNLWNAKTGRVFLVKWIACSAIGASLQATCLALSFLYAFEDDPMTIFLSSYIPVLLQVWCIFGFRWRLWAWIAIHWLIGAIFSDEQAVESWPVFLIATSLRISSETALLIGVRRHLGIWPVAMILVCLVEFTVWSATPLNEILSHWTNRLPISVAGHVWVHIQLGLSQGVISDLIPGVALAWLMPPVDGSERPESAASPSGG